MAHVRRLGGSREEYPAWRRWIRAIGAAREHYVARTGTDPVSVSEATTVGLMLSSAGSAGLIGLLEYPTEKKHRRKNDWCYGRCDLWLLAPRRHGDEEGWAFEIKHRRITSRSPRLWLLAPFREAWRDAGALDVSEASMRLACTIFYSERDIDPESVCAKTLDRLTQMSDWSWRISHDRHLPPFYIFLKHRRRGNRCAVAP